MVKSTPLGKTASISIWGSSPFVRESEVEPAVVQLPEHSGVLGTSIERPTLKHVLCSAMNTVAGGWSSVNKSVAAIIKSCARGMAENLGKFHTFAISQDWAYNSNLTSSIRGTYDTTLNQLLSQGRTNAQQTGNVFRTLCTAIKELSTETTTNIASSIDRNLHNTGNRTMRAVLKDPYAENQFSRVRASSARGALLSNDSEPAQQSSPYNISTLSAFVGRWYRQGRLLFGAKSQPPTENLSDAVLAYLAAADSLGIEFKDLSAVAATEESTRPAKFSWLNFVPNLWRRKTSASGQPDVSKSLPSKADLSFVHSRRTEMAIAAALAVHSQSTAQDFVKHVGLQPLLAALQPRFGLESEHKVDAVRGLSTLVQFHPPLAVAVASMPEVVSVLCDMLEAPTIGFAFWRSHKDATRKEKEQHIAVELVLRMVRSSELAGDILRQNQRLRKILLSVGQFHSTPKHTASAESSEWAREAVRELEQSVSSPKSNKGSHVKSPSNGSLTAIPAKWETHQMARIAAWGLGGVPWRPKLPGQKGLRILSLDGGGTRGVLSIAILREIMKRVHGDQDSGLEPHQMFDIICGTSTGGIIATLLGTQRASLSDTEILYDAFIEKIFGSRSNMRLVTSQAAYDERDWEKILHDMCGDALMLDSNQYDCPRVFCVSARANTHPPTPNLWRNYNYPPGQVARYPGACRVSTFKAIRSTTAAPTFFTPVHWEDGLYFDGALVANNPTAIAMQEAKVSVQIF